ncbi:hypothetical protein MLD52_20305 [Puniceicoccaceae bacterium K14]|nr:hypothetical protein [Puniceicoccaceae bacterium K14]
MEVFGIEKALSLRFEPLKTGSGLTAWAGAVAATMRNAAAAAAIEAFFYLSAERTVVATEKVAEGFSAVPILGRCGIGETHGCVNRFERSVFHD